MNITENMDKALQTPIKNVQQNTVRNCTAEVIHGAAVKN